MFLNKSIQIHMKNKISFVVVVILSLQACQAPVHDLPRIAIAGLGIESSTFSPAQTKEEAFHAQTGSEILNNYPFLSVDQ